MTDYTERAREWLEGKECPWPISVEGWSTGTLHALTTLLVSVAAEAREQQRKEEAVMTCYATGDARPCSLFPDLCKCNPTGKEFLHVQEAVMTLNERIAKVKGWKLMSFADLVTVKRIQFYEDSDQCMHDVKDWSGSIADAWGLVEDIPKFGLNRREKDGEVAWYAWADHIGCRKPTAPEAICLAYLAVMEDRDE